MNPHSSLAEQFGQIYGRRREWREYHTAEIAIRTTHNRRKRFTRAGILIAFALSMVIYPMFGTLSPAAAGYAGLGLDRQGKGPSPVALVMGEMPQLESVDLPLPSIDDTARSIANNTEYIVSTRLPNCSGSVKSVGTNGNLSADSLCKLWDGTNEIRSDAAVALAELNYQYKLKFGEDMCLQSSYRSYADQVRVKATQGWKAATPGQSYHGWGLAIDLCSYQDHGESFDWLKQNGPAFGWDNPRWATIIKYEPWHWEYTPGTDKVGIYVSDEAVDAAIAAKEAAEKKKAEEDAAGEPDPDPTETTAP